MGGLVSWAGWGVWLAICSFASGGGTHSGRRTGGQVVRACTKTARDLSGSVTAIQKGIRGG